MSDPALQGVKAEDPNHNAIPERLAVRFDPAYLELWNKYNRGKLHTHQIPVEEFRKDPAKYTVTYGRWKGPDVYKITDLKCPVEGAEIAIRVYEPEPTDTLRGAYINFHGGGWVFGNLEAAKEHLKRLVKEVGCVAIDVDYRLAPENRYPTCVDDSWAAYQWIVKELVPKYNIDPNRLAVGGDSAGGHLAAVISILARDNSLPLAFQLLSVPVTDLTASFDQQGNFRQDTPHNSYRDMYDTQPLSCERMEYFAKHWLGVPRPAEWDDDWKISPIRCPDLKGLAPALVFVAEMDPLRDEGIAYAKKLEEASVPVELVEAKGCPHTVMMVDDVLEGGKEWNRQAVKNLTKYIGTKA